jgi:4-hydroxyproline epimerase
MSGVRRVRVVDTHTGGEPTRVVVDGGPELGDGSMAARRRLFREQFDDFRSAVVNEPRGSDVMVGALLCRPTNSSCVAGVIYFNNVGPLNMCGHGTIGVVVALAHLGRIGPGKHRLETPVGDVGFEYHGNNRVTIENVPSYRLEENVTVDVPEAGPVTGDVAWGGNWFFLSRNHGQQIEFSRVPQLLEFTSRLRQELEARNITGAEGAEIDHIELLGVPGDPANNARSFVLCPGREYDRSPCGTGTSAKLACLHADGKLQPGETWRQESIIGSVFEASYRLDGEGRCIPRVTGTAWVNAESTLILDPADPFCMGIR